MCVKSQNNLYIMFASIKMKVENWKTHFITWQTPWSAYHYCVKNHILLIQTNRGEQDLLYSMNFKYVVSLCIYIHNFNLKFLDTMENLLYLILNGN